MFRYKKRFETLRKTIFQKYCKSEKKALSLQRNSLTYEQKPVK